MKLNLKFIAKISQSVRFEWFNQICKYDKSIHHLLKTIQFRKKVQKKSRICAAQIINKVCMILWG